MHFRNYYYRGDKIIGDYYIPPCSSQFSVVNMYQSYNQEKSKYYNILKGTVPNEIIAQGRELDHFKSIQVIGLEHKKYGRKLVRMKRRETLNGLMKPIHTSS